MKDRRSIRRTGSSMRRTPKTRPDAEGTRPAAVALPPLAGALLAGLALAAPVLAGGPGGPTTDPPALGGLVAWWQFDRDVRFEDGVEGASLVLVSGGAFVESPTGVHLAYRASPANDGALRASDSDVQDHWSMLPGGALGGLVVARLDALPEAGAEGTLVSRWNGEDASWRLGVADDGDVVLRWVDSAARELRANGPGAGATAAILFGLDESAGLASLHVYDPALGLVDTASAPIDGQVAATTAFLEFGRHDQDGATSAEATIDAVAFWDRAGAPLASDVASIPPPVRYAHAAGAQVLEDPGRHLDRIAGVFEGDVRHVIVGDSFVNHRGWGRVFPGLLKVRAIPEWTAFVAGASPTHVIVPHQTTDLGEPDNPRDIEAGDVFGVEWLGGIAPDDHYGVPVLRASELRVHPGLAPPPGGAWWTPSIDDAGMADGATGPFTSPGDRVRIELLHRGTSTADRQVAAAWLAPAGDAAAGTLVDLSSPTSRQASRGVGAIEIDVVPGGTVAWTIGPDPGAPQPPADERFLDLLGSLVQKVDAKGARLPGLYWSHLGDNSWSTHDYRQDAEAGPTNSKTVSTEQMAHWLTATTIDPSQPMVTWWYLDSEHANNTWDPDESIPAMLDLFDAALVEAGLPATTHCIVIAHKHFVSNRLPTNSDDNVGIVAARFRDAAFAAADARPNVCAFSIFDATDGVWFDGRPEAVAWLEQNGYDAFEYGVYTGPVAIDLTRTPDLLDGVRRHPAGQDAGVFFASFLAAAVPAAPAPCPTDLDGDGQTGFGDLLALITAWGSCPGCAADLDDDGLVGFGDLVLILTAWGPCPGG